MSTGQKEEKKKLSNNHRIVTSIGIALVAMSLVLLLLIFYPLIFAEIRYYLGNSVDKEVLLSAENAGQDEQNNVIQPVDESFGIVIPKISVNSKIVANVDSTNPKEYQKKLTEGVAHAKGTSLPGKVGNIFLFAHSGSNFYEANRFNAVFYLLDKMEKGDDIYIFYQGKKIRYQVDDKRIIPAEELEIGGEAENEKLTLMTCWPPGTTWKRLIVIAKQV